MDRLYAMETFLHVVEQGSFSRAAERIGRSKAVVSKTISHLEDRLGIRLLNRTTRRISLTEAGTEYYEHCHLLAPSPPHHYGCRTNDKDRSHMNRANSYVLRDPVAL